MWIGVKSVPGDELVMSSSHPSSPECDSFGEDAANFCRNGFTDDRSVHDDGLFMFVAAFLLSERYPFHIWTHV